MPVPKPESRQLDWTAEMGKVFQIKSKISYSHFSWFLHRKMEKEMRIRLQRRLQGCTKLPETKVEGMPALWFNDKKIRFE